MTNEEKANEIANSYSSDVLQAGAYFGAAKMAEWKDHQFKEYLEKKKSQYSQAVTTFDVMRKKVIQELINELFKEK